MKVILMCVAAALAAVAVTVTLAGCGGGSSSGASGGTRVVASFYPLAYAADEIGGAGVDVENLTPAGAEPHDLEVSPRDVATIRSADLVLLLGEGFQPQLEDAAGAGDNVLRLLDTPGLRRFENNDPHVWLDPIRYALIARRVGTALHDERAAARFAARLRALDREFRRGLARCERRDVVTSHEAFGYLARRYGLRQVAISGLAPEAEPAPQELRRVIDVVRRTHARAVFFERLVSPRVAETVARETGARTAVLDPLEGLTPQEVSRGATYFTLMRANLATLRHALGCR
jgi:zinc transport system substrate-binding protein